MKKTPVVKLEEEKEKFIDHTQIVTDLDKLHVRCDEVNTSTQNKEIREIILALKTKIREDDLIALSANQLGYDKRVMVLNFGGNLRSFVNPIISNAKGLEMSREQCPSLPNRTFLIPRNNQVIVTYMTPLGKIESANLKGLAARVAQRQINLLDGSPVSDIGLEIDELFDQATEDEKAQLIKAYIDSLDLMQKDLEKEIKDDKELSELSKAVDVLTKIQKGEIQIKPIEAKSEVGDNGEDIKIEEGKPQ